MITGQLKSKIDAVWNDFWSGGISNPLEVMEQLTLLLFIKGLDDAQTRAERKANRTGQDIENPIFSDGRVNLVIEELTANGVVDPARVYENPYASIVPGGPEDLFDEATLDEFFAALDDLTKAAG